MLHKSWQDRRPGFTRRVRWYEGPDDVRLQFEEFGDVWNRIFTDRGKAQLAWEAFVAFG